MTKVLILANENRVMIETIKKDIGEIKESIKNISNHYSKRLPLWATFTLTILASLVTGLIIGGV